MTKKSTLKGYDRYIFIKKKLYLGDNLKDCARSLGLKHQSVRKWWAKNQYIFSEEEKKQKKKVEEDPSLAFEVGEDTRGWTWERWCKHFLGKILLSHQIENLRYFDTMLTMLNDPRQHGKSMFCVEPFIVRKLCESIYEKVDRPILYVGNVEITPNMANEVRIQLVENKAILEHYGEIVDYAGLGQRNVRAPQTAYKINLITRRDTSLTSFHATTSGAAIRGTNAYYVIIDDPVDLKQPENYAKATRDFLVYLKAKIGAIVKAHLIIIGTRYAVDDLYAQLNELRIFEWITRSSIIGALPSFTKPETGTIKPTNIIVHGDVELLAPSLWATADNPFRCGTPAQNIIFNLHFVGERLFMQEQMNDPLPVNSLLKFDLLTPFDVFPVPARNMRWAIFVDVNAGETKHADFTAMVLVAYHQNRYYIVDILHGRWTGKQRQDKLEKFVNSSESIYSLKHETIKVLIETVLNQRGFYQRIRDESFIRPKNISPSKRNEKHHRITHGLGQEIENKTVRLKSTCRNVAQLRTEMGTFPNGEHDDVIDASDQCIYYLKHNKGIKRGIRGTV